MRKEQQLIGEMNNMERKLTECENKAAVMGGENTRLNEALESRMREINSLKAQINQLTK